MASRKSSRIKKSPVVYQAPEPVHRARNVTPKQIQPRRSFSRDIELQMECVEDELSPAQLKAIKEAQKEHEKANDLIKEVRAGNILVPSAQPNTFTIVPPKSTQQQPKPQQQQQQKGIVSVQVPIIKAPSPPVDISASRGLPPPRPAQFLNKQLQEIHKTQAAKSADVILIDDVSVSAAVQVPQVAMLPAQGASATPQQMYKFVSLPSSMPTNMIQNQWALRPLLTVSPQQQHQQQQQHVFLTAGLTQFSPVGTVAMQLGQGQMSAPRSTNVSAPASQPVKSTESAGKRSAQSEPASAQPPAKKKTLKATDVPDQSGNWVPLDEYYYGTHDGDTTYTEEKGEYRFKCWYCSKMLYNNVRAMQHIQGHIDASKQQNIDLSDLTQCKHCYKQFDTPFEMQTHVEKVHLSNKVLMCRICEKDFATPRELMAHMKSNHHAMEMPYMCHLCHFRSSMYSDVVDHFKKKHDSSHYLLCLYCLRTFEVKFVSQGWGQTQTYYGHLLKHQSKSSTKKCVVCRLTFFNSGDVKNHRRTCHVTSFSDVIASSHGSRSDSAQKQKKGSTLKSLNAPSISRIQDYGDITFPAQTSSSKCIECKMMMSSTDHYKKYVHCSMCRFATSCSVAYANHMMGFHSGQMSSLNLNIPWERPMKQVMYCSCGYSSKYGNKVANHLVYCAKWTCSSKKQEQTSTAKREAGEKKKEGSLLGMLGLVQKSTVATTDEDQSEIRSVEKPKSNAKLETKVVGQVREVKHPKDLKLDTKPIDEDIQEISDSDTLKRQKDKQRNVEALTKDAISTEISEAFSDMTSEEVKKSDSEMPQKGRNKSEHNVTETADIKENIDSNTGGSSMEVSKNLEEAMPDKNTEVLKEEKSEKGQNDVEKKIDNETDKNLQKPAVDKNKELMDTEESEVIELDTHVKSSQDKAECAMEDKLEEMDTVLVEKPTDVSEDSSIENNTTSKQPQETSESIEKMDKSLSEVSAKSEEKTKEIKNTSENMKQENDLKGEGKEMCQENVVDTEMELDSQGPSKESKEMDLENNDENQSKLNETVSKNLSTDDSSVKNENIGSEDEGETREEETEDMADDQKSAETADRETGSKDDADRESGSKDGKPAMEEKEKKGTDSESKASEAHGDSDHSSSMSKDQDDHTESSEVHSGKRTESDERRHTGDKSKHDDRPHDADRRHRDNRSHSSSRSDSHHGNRSGSDAHRDRDRSHDRDRNRDYNRNRDYTYGDNRSGYSYQDNRGQGYTGGQGYRASQGQHGGYHGNRGDHSQNRNRGGHHQDRNYNRNYQNRGGYNQNYRGGYRGGYY